MSSETTPAPPADYQCDNFEARKEICIRPKPNTEHVTFHSFLQKVRNIPGELGGANLLFVEDVAYQKAAIQEMERALLPVVPMKPQGDKRARLQVVAPYIENGMVLFPRPGCEELLGQMVNLGFESHDDLNDALVYLLQSLVSQGLELPKIHWIEAQVTREYLIPFESHFG
jgi:predicted phage terminase large subunit-like protein